MNSSRILIGDDHTAIRIGLRFLLETHFNCRQIDEAEDYETLTAKLHEQDITHLILDLQLQDINMISFFPDLHARYPDLKILVYSMSDEDLFARRMLQMGADGYLSKKSNGQEVRKALNLFLMGRTYKSEQIEFCKPGDTTAGAPVFNPFEDLSEREMEVAIDLLQGKKLREIAGRLKIRISTVSTYKTRIFEKAGVRHILDLKNIASQCRFIGA